MYQRYIFAFSLICAAYLAITQRSDLDQDVLTLEVDSTHVLPSIDEYGHPHLNIPQLVVSEFADPYEALININMIASSVFFHYWMGVIDKADALERLCKLHSLFPIDCRAYKQKQHNYTHCQTATGYLSRLAEYGTCPTQVLTRALAHQGQDLAFGADILYREFVILIDQISM